MDNVQLFLVIVIVTLTILVMIVGLQVFLMILEVRSILKKIDIMLSDLLVGGGLINSEKLMNVFSLLKNKKDKNLHEIKEVFGPEQKF
ncbi:MAG: hypothetical protein N2558_03125 [Patescibacteria group bacterium]|nr:hypothetical protein [Patescibacteria group bacterium]